MRALCFGSLNIDYTYRVDHIVLRGETIHSSGLALHAGGKGLNQSIALAKAGATTYHAGCIGRDGDFLLEEMREAGVHTEHVRILDEVRTGNALIQNDKGGDNAIVLYGGANQAIEASQIDAVLESFSAGDYLVMQNEINQMAYLCERAHARGMKLVLNPAPMNEAVMHYPLEYIDYLVVNEIEAAQLLELLSLKRREEEMLRLARELQIAYPQAAVILTCGALGAIYADAEQCFLQESFPCEVVDTTAAGDTFIGYFVAETMRGAAPAEAMYTATKASSVAVTRPGAAGSIPTRAELQL